MPDGASVTICVTYHDEPDEILWRAIGSARTQTVAPLEIIVVDDGSETKPFTVKWQNPDGIQLRCVSITNRGLPAARNTGLMLSKTEAIIFLDADDWLEPDFIKETQPHIEDGADAVLVGLQEHGPSRNGTYMPGYDRPWHLVTLADEIQMNRFFYCANFRVSTLREVGGYHPYMAGAWGANGGYEDWSMWIELMTRKAKFAAVDKVLLNYTTKPDSMVTRAERNREALVAEIHRHHRLP